MMKRPLHMMLRLMLVFLPVLLALAHARAQGVDTINAGQSTKHAVVPFEGVTYHWELYNDVTGINFAADPGNCPPSEAYFVGGVATGDSVEIMWLVQGIYFFKVTANDSCTDNLKVGKMVVLGPLPYANFLEPASICMGDTATLTVEIMGGTGPWDITFTDGVNVWLIEDIQESPYTFQLIPSPALSGSYQYWITSVTDSIGTINDTPSDPVTLTVYPKPITSPIYRY